jgi:hypothetical protein
MDATSEVGRIEIDLAKHLDPRVFVTEIGVEDVRTEPIKVSMR